MPVHEQLQLFLSVLEVSGESGCDAVALRLMAQGLDREQAGCWIAFVPMGFAHALLVPAGVTLPGTYLIEDAASGEQVRGHLADEDSFNAAHALARDWLAEGRVQDVHDVAAYSAEYSVAMELAGQAGDFHNVVCTEAMLMRLPVSHLKPVKSGWRRWFR